MEYLGEKAFKKSAFKLTYQLDLPIIIHTYMCSECNLFLILYKL